MNKINSSYFAVVAESFFPKSILDIFKDSYQYGFNNYIEKEIKKVGVAVNLTADIIEQAKNSNIDLILTHHNIWEEMLEMADDCLNLLKKYNIIHYYNHLPLDSMHFGPTQVLAKQLGIKITNYICKIEDIAFGVVGELEIPITIEELTKKLENILSHEVRVWKNNNNLISRIGLCAGSSGDIESLHDAVINNCDVYITGEKKMKTILYAKHMNLNFLLGSHIFTELSGIREYAKLINEKMLNIEFINLVEKHIE